MFENVKLTKIVRVSRSRTAPTYDIEVDNEFHAFVAKHPSGGIGVSHNSAQIAIGDCDDVEFLLAKRWDMGNIPSWRAMSNNSVVCDDINDLHDYFWQGYEGKGEPYGLINLKLSRKVGRLGEDKYPDKGIMVYNPCVVGDTLVYTADGRGDVSISELASIGKDVPVFCFDSDNKLAIRTMRAPRKTGEKLPIYEVLLDDGSVVRTTGNHKLKMRTGEYIEVSQLKTGESLKILTKFNDSFGDIFQNNHKSQDYVWLNHGHGNTAEHRYIAAFHNNIDSIPEGHVVHHCDHNAINNVPNNLQIMLAEDHQKYHSEKMIGELNPINKAKKEWTNEKWGQYLDKLSEAQTGLKNARAIPITNDQLRIHMLQVTSEYGRRITLSEWNKYAKENNLPSQFSKYRTDHLNGGIVGFAKWAALEKGYEHANLSKDMAIKYLSLLKDGYDCEIINGTVVINKICEECGKSFQTQLREHGLCSASCSNTQSWKNPDILKKQSLGIRFSHAKNKEKVASKQMEIYSSLKFNLGKEPLKMEWIEACKKVGVSVEIGRKSSPIPSYQKLKELATDFNHKVVSVSHVGYEDVYNGTVDEFHNFFIGGFKSKCKNGKTKTTYINNLQCGEQGLASNETCCLAEIFLPNITSKEELLDVATLLYRINKHSLALPCHQYSTEKIVHTNMRMGIGVTGIMESTEEQKSWLSDTYVALREFDNTYSEQHGFAKSIKLTTCKPSGTLSLLPGVTPGIHPAYARYMIRRIRISADHPLVQTCREHGYKVSYQENFDGSQDRSTVVVEFPFRHSDVAVLANDVNAISQLEAVKWLQAVWSDNSVSCTIYYKLEELPEIRKYLKKNYKTNHKSLSFLLHSEHGFKQAPLEEITKEHYDEIVQNTRTITEIASLDIGLDDAECATGACPTR